MSEQTRTRMPSGTPQDEGGPGVTPVATADMTETSRPTVRTAASAAAAPGDIGRRIAARREELGLTREVVYRALAALERQKLIDRGADFVSLTTREGA